MHTNRLLKQNFTKRLISIFWSVLILTAIVYVVPANAATNTHATYKNGILTITKPDGQILEINSTGDLDNDGIADTLEINGFTYDRNNGLQPWNGDSEVEYYRTDPDRWSTDGDPYGDWMEVSGVQMPSFVKNPENHPLVAARPVIKVGMSSYVVTPIETISTSNGGEQSGSFTNETSSTTEKGTDVEASAGWSAKDGLSFGASVSKSYSQSWSRTNSSTSSIASNWETARTADPSNAAKLKLNVYLENIGSATAYDVIPTFNLVLGNKTIATITPESKAESLAPGDRYPAGTGTIAVPEANASYEIILTLDELKAIQLGAPLGLVVIQVAANVARWDATQNLWFIDKPWSVFENEIDPVVVNLKANLGNGENFNFQVYIGTEYYDLGLTFEEVLSLVFTNFDNTGGQTSINGRKYPENWFVSTTSDSVKDEWNRRSRPESLLDFKMFSETYMIMTSPGDDPEADVNMAIFSPDYKYVYASAFSQNFPIVSVKARVKINDVYQEVELSDIDSLGREVGLFSNNKQFMYVTDPTGEVIVENAAGDITTVPIFRPKFYSSAEDIKANTNFLPNPGDEYFIALQGDSTKIVKLYCQFFDLVTGDTLQFPNEYLTLPVHAHDANYLDWYIDGQSPGRVYYDKIRIWSDELQVIGWDLTWTHGDIPENWIDDIVLKSVSYGSIRLNGDFVDSAFANIDLTGTPYSLAPDTEFEYGLYGPAYSSIFIDASRQIAEITAIKPQDDTWDATRYAGMQPYRFNLIYKRETDLEKSTFASSVNSVQIDQEGFVNMGENGPDVGTQTTMEAWINPTSYVSENGESAYILGKEKRFSISVPADGTIQLGLAFDENTWNTYNMHYQTVPGEWIHVAYTFDFDPVERYTIRGYINGNLFHEFKVNAIGELLGDGNPGSFTVGSRFWNEDSPYYSAGIDELRFWNVVRTQEEIQSTMTDTLGSAIYSTDQNGLTGYWRFDELEDLGINYVQGGGADGNDDVRDLSVNARHGDLSEYGAGLTASTITAVDLNNSDKTILAHDFSLDQNYPNPFNPTTTIDFSVARAGQVNLAIFNVRGQEMATLVNEPLAPGSYKAQLDARSWPSGIYFYQLTADGQQVVKRMILMK